MQKNTKKFKIAFVLDDGLDSEDGVQQYIRVLGEYFIAHGHKVDYLVGQTARRDLDNVYSIPKNIRVKFNGNRLTIPYHSSRQKIAEILKNEDYDVVHVQVPYSPIFGAKVVTEARKNLPDCIVVGTFHIAPYGPTTKIGTKLLGTVLKRNLKKFDQFISVSEAGKNFAKASFKIDSKVIPNAVNLKKYTPASVSKKQSKTLRLVFVGRLVERKGCRHLIEALKILRDDYEDINYNLIICGKGSLSVKIQELVDKYGLSDRVKLVGFVTERDKIKYLQSADIAIFPSYAGESFGIVLIEAMAAGAGVVIGGDNPGYRTVLGATHGVLMPVKDHQLFAYKLNEIMTSPEKRTKIHAVQAKQVHRYDVETVGRQIIDFYFSLKRDRI